VKNNWPLVEMLLTFLAVGGFGAWQLVSLANEKKKKK
jgi:hypothetical protein